MKDYSTDVPTCANTPEIPPLLRDNQDLVLNLDSENTSTPRIARPRYGLSLGYPIQPLRNAQRTELLSFQVLANFMQTGAEYRELLDYRGCRNPALGDLIRRAATALDIPQSALRPRAHDAPLFRVMVNWHWGSAEMGSLSDYKRIMAHPEVIDLNGCVCTLKPVEYTFNLGDSHAHYGRVLLTIRDTRLLLDPDTGKSLDALGALLGMRKIDIESQGYRKDRMDILMQDNFPLYEQYTMRDVEIVKYWIWEQSKMQREILCLDDLAPTIGSAAANGLRKFIDQEYKNGVSPEGFADTFDLVWNKKDRDWKPRKNRAWDESMGVECFLGGMNQTYQLGDVYGTIMDIDISGAYAGAMGCIKVNDYELSHSCGPCDPRELTNPLDFALVTFSFPEGCEYPCLPISTSHGLIGSVPQRP
jgi:hypothetical protein